MILAESLLKGNTICYSLDNTADIGLFCLDFGAYQ
jgi:hypothetical protein